jgi:hypothetical protein
MAGNRLVYRDEICATIIIEAIWQKSWKSKNNWDMCWDKITNISNYKEIRRPACPFKSQPSAYLYRLISAR